MRASTVESRDDFCRVHENLTIANAVAKIIRAHPKPIQWAMAEYDLTEGEARGALYAQASRATIDKILKHRNGGWAALLQIGEAVIGQPLEHHLIKVQGEQDRARKAIEDQARRTADTAARLGALRDRLRA